MKEAEFPEAEAVRELERVVLLKVIDRKWMDHIDDMDQLRQGIGLQAYGQREQVAKVTGTNRDESLQKGPKKRENVKVYPNDPCPCGSGKKYKQCCGRK